MRRPGDPLFKIFIKIRITSENNISENMNTFLPRSKIWATVFNNCYRYEFLLKIICSNFRPIFVCAIDII
jgi:hypothetical protein